MPRGIPNKKTKRAPSARGSSPALLKTRTALASVRAKAKLAKKTARAAFIEMRATAKALKAELRATKVAARADNRSAAKALKKYASIMKRATKLADRNSTILATKIAVVKKAPAPKVAKVKAVKAPKVAKVKAVKAPKAKVSRRAPVAAPNPKAVAALKRHAKSTVSVAVTGVVPSTGDAAPLAPVAAPAAPAPAPAAEAPAAV